MENKNYEALYEEFMRERTALLEDEQMDHGILFHSSKLASLLSHTKKYLQKLRDSVLLNDLTISEEIKIFRFYKPRLYRWLIYDTELFAIRRQAPPEGGEKAVAYYKEQLHYFSLSLKQYDFLYHYYRLGATEMDHVYFVRNTSHDGVLAPIVPDADPDFSTGGDYLFARFMATEMLIEEIREIITEPAASIEGSHIVSRKGRSIKWTGDSCNLVEVVYGIYETGMINRGDVDLQDIIDVFEQVFSISLNRYYRRFTEIKRRKSSPQTRFLDEMQKAVMKKIDDGDAYVPKSMR